MNNAPYNQSRRHRVIYQDKSDDKEAIFRPQPPIQEDINNAQPPIKYDNKIIAHTILSSSSEIRIVRAHL